MQTLYLTIFEYNLNEQKQDEMTKLQTPNTYASCGRNDPARKRRLNPIPSLSHGLYRMEVKIVLIPKNYLQSRAVDYMVVKYIGYM
jgi:hypothetical protein